LPERIEVGALSLLGSVGGAIEFDDDWRPRALPIVRSIARASFTAPYVARLKLTLKPVFERLGLQWTAPPVAKGRQALLITSSVIFVLSGGLWLALKLPEWFYEPPADSASYAPYSDTYTEVPSVTDALPSEPQPASAYDQALAAFAARSNEVPELAAAMSGATNSEEARGIGRELSRRGLHRLSDARLLERAAIMSRVLALADLQTCATMMKGTARGMEPVLRQLDAADIDTFFDMSFEAMVAEARQESGPPLPTQEELSLALQALVERLPSEEGERLVAVLGDPQLATDDDGCSAARSLYAGMTELPEAHQVVLACGLVAPE
jgi:hypothetical protein